jgi:hypothetical protein
MDGYPPGVREGRGSFCGAGLGRLRLTMEGAERLGVRGIRVEAGGRRRLRCWGGFDQAEFRIGGFGHRWILPVDSVHGSGVIFCNG